MLPIGMRKQTIPKLTSNLGTLVSKSFFRFGYTWIRTPWQHSWMLLRFTQRKMLLIESPSLSRKGSRDHRQAEAGVPVILLIWTFCCWDSFVTGKMLQFFLLQNILLQSQVMSTITLPVEGCTNNILALFLKIRSDALFCKLRVDLPPYRVGHTTPYSRTL